MQYKVPQNVDMEDRVVGPLSLRQFLIMMVTVAILIVIYFVFPPGLRFIYFLLALLIAGAGLAIAFTKYGDQNMETFIMSAIKTFVTPRQRIWKKTPEPIQTMSAAEVKKPEIKKTKKSLSEARDDLNRLAELVDSGGYVSVSQKDRVLGQIDKNNYETGDGNVPDLIGRSEKTNSRLEGAIANATQSAPKREPLISEVASVKPNKEYQYPKIGIKDNHDQ